MNGRSVSRSLLTAALVGMAAVFVALALGRGQAGVVGGLIGLVLLIPLPGYALTRALFGSRAMDGAERLVLVLGLGIGTAILTGLVLSSSPVGMSRGSW